MDDKLLDINVSAKPETIIKVIGVGGGGGNAVSNMYKEGIHDVSFVLCNTDMQALNGSAVPAKLLLGRNTTHGRGSGNRPEKGREAAEESTEEIRAMLSDGTQMTFITAGMGGGTGTGAGPIVAKISKEMGILTVGIVTIPFLFEGRPKIVKALKGVREMAKNVDALLVINNERLRKLSAEERLSVPKAYKKADETLTIAAKSIAEIITIELVQNVDFADVDTTMRNSGVALMSIGYGEGEKRLQHAIDRALHNSLLNDNDNIFNAKRLLFVIYFSEEAELGMDEMQDIHDFMARFKTEYEVKWGFGYDNTLGQQIKITILATGFGVDDILAEERGMEAEMDKKNAEEEERKRKQQEEEENEWIFQAYGEDMDIHPRAEVTILTAEQLDDDQMIAVLEETPTYRRGRVANGAQSAKNVSKGKGNNTPSDFAIQF
ncbi:cell division protein FtsZ [Parabacteroides sp. An277]|uniref:cell division protein FtsZ n=1 Tax=Parabacteroides sp. An277 TaxID=1965619 RepID=UPI000B380FD7|nr:cell division protein FtsZ [Parabacteroides sp. An277]OUO55582.1 cell division protein FtsZ [Parabacteroides sp. An277]